MKYRKSVWIVIAVVLLVVAALVGWLAPADVRLMLAGIVAAVMIVLLLVELVKGWKD